MHGIPFRVVSTRRLYHGFSAGTLPRNLSLARTARHDRETRFARKYTELVCDHSTSSCPGAGRGTGRSEFLSEATESRQRHADRGWQRVAVTFWKNDDDLAVVETQVVLSIRDVGRQATVAGDARDEGR